MLQINHRHAQAVARVAANGGIHGLHRCALPSPLPQCEVAPAHIALGNQRHQGIHHGTGFGHHHEAAGVFVQAVHDARAGHLHSPSVVGQQAVEQGAAPIARRGVYDQTGGFVHHQQMLIFKHHV